MSYHYSRPRPNLPPPVQRVPKGTTVPVVSTAVDVVTEPVVETEVVETEVVETEVVAEPVVETEIVETEPVVEIIEVLPELPEPAGVDPVVEATAGVVEAPVVVETPPVAEPEVVVTPEPEVVEEHKAPLWKPSMNKAELLAIAASLGLTLTDENTKVQIVEALKNLDPDNT